MPTPTAWPSLGTTLAYSIDAGVTWVAIGQVLSISGAGGGEVGKRDTTNLASAAKTYAPTIPDNGEPSFEINWDPTDTAHVQLMTWKDTPAAVNPQWKVTFATTGTHTSVFAGFVSNFDGPNAGGVDDNLTATVTITVSGPVTHV